MSWSNGWRRFPPNTRPGTSRGLVDSAVPDSGVAIPFTLPPRSLLLGVRHGSRETVRGGERDLARYASGRPVPAVLSRRLRPRPMMKIL